MKSSISNQYRSPSIFKAVRNFIEKLRQSPDVYPIKYYKKSRRFKRNWQENIVK